MGWTYRGRSASAQGLPGYGDCSPYDDTPEFGVDYGECAWCERVPIYDSEGKMTGIHSNLIGRSEAVICDGLEAPAHFVVCPHDTGEWPLWACQECHDKGRTDYGPDECPDDAALDNE